MRAKKKNSFIWNCQRRVNKNRKDLSVHLTQRSGFAMSLSHSSKIYFLLYFSLFFFSWSLSLFCFLLRGNALEHHCLLSCGDALIIPVDELELWISWCTLALGCALSLSRPISVEIYTMVEFIRCLSRAHWRNCHNYPVIFFVNESSV